MNLVIYFIYRRVTYCDVNAVERCLAHNFSRRLIDLLEEESLPAVVNVHLNHEEDIIAQKGISCF